jgi:hypothetical protein
MNNIYWIYLVPCTALAVPASASTQATYIQLVRQAPTVTTVHASTPSALTGSRVVLTVGVSLSNGPVVPSGTVVITDGENAPSSVILVNGSASMAEEVSSIGPHQITACYLGNNNLAASCSHPFSLTSLPPYTLTPTIQSATVVPLIPFTDQLTIVPAPGYVGAVQLSCQTKVGYYQCAVSPSVVSLVGSGDPQVIAATFIPYVPWPAGSFIALPLTGILTLKRQRKNAAPKILSVLAAATLLVGLVGCGSGITGPYLPTRPGSYRMVVSATSKDYNQSVTYQIAVK